MNNDEVRESSVSRNNQFSALFLLYRFRRPKADSSVASKKTKLNEIKLSTGKTAVAIGYLNGKRRECRYSKAEHVAGTRAS